MGRPACTDPHSGGYARAQVCVALPAYAPLQLPRYPDPGAHRYLEGKLNVPVCLAGVGFYSLACECEEAGDPLFCKITDVGPV